MENEIKRGRKKKKIDGDFAKLLSELLQDVKIANGIIQDNVAKSIGVSRQALGKWANGETVPDILDLKKLAKYFDVSADYLLGLTENATTDTDLKAVCDYTGLSEDAVNSVKRFKDIFLSLKDKEVDRDAYLRLLNEYDVYNWLLSTNYISEIASELEVVLYSSEQIINNKKDEARYDNETICDLARYRLIKLMENLSNRFDQRELVQDNGKHNPSEE